ncbi:hypothetical protein KIN20_007380 [Parelaphostrongylus tenuis]|uniref:Protein kinase domain-containing protein n=1 Tax=Parelaphostrongylus tenuis TaxID=148309 RepID=A0AAD5QHU4_PARTN|nr:hypothetical protein KIN20_007380 [Parelaphostrongylus tenuis]
MGTEGKIKVDEHYPTDVDEPPLFDAKKIDRIRSNVKFDQCYECSKQIGDGKFGKVYEVREKASGQEFAAKVIRLKKQADRQEVEREVAILTQLRHPRIAQIYDAFYTLNNEVVLIMEIVRGGELFDRVADENYVLTELAVVMIICQLCEAIDYIHEQNILHLDIKPENIMCVSQKGNRIKLIDFGLARYYDGTQELRYMAGTPEFAAPEVIKYEQLDYHTDMWSVGVITYILLSGYSPFLGENIAETYCNVEKGVWEFTEEFDAVSSEARDFISRLIVYKKEERMLPKECLAHPWISTHRAKVSCDANLEQPADGPVMDNRQMLRYNAKRKLRRMFIYVKFLIEVNRLRSMIKGRMSQSGLKYFEPLLKIAEENQKQASQAVSSKEDTKTSNIVKLEKAASSSKLDTMKETKGFIEVNGEDKQQTLISRKRRNCASSSPGKPRSPPVQMSSAIRLGEKESNKVTVKKPPRMLNEENTVKGEETVSKNSVCAMAKIVSKTTVENLTPVQTTSKTLGKTISSKQKFSVPEVIITDPSRKSASYETISTITDNITSLVSKRGHSTDNVLKKSTVNLVSTLPEGRSISTESTLRTENKRRKSQDDNKTFLCDVSATRPPHPTITMKTKSTTKKKKSTAPASQNVLSTSISLDETTTVIDNKSRDLSTKNSPSRKTASSDDERSLGVRKSSDPETIINVPPRKTVLGAPKIVIGELDKCTPIRMQRFGSSESGDSAKENRTVEEKKPTRQGALRKKEKPEENLATILQPPLASSTQPGSLTTSVLKKQPDANVSVGQQEAAVGIKTISPKPGSSIHERLLKLNACVNPISVNLVTDSKLLQKGSKSEERQKPEKYSNEVLRAKSDCKTTKTAASSSPSAKTRAANLHKGSTPADDKLCKDFDTTTELKQVQLQGKLGEVNHEI